MPGDWPRPVNRCSVAQTAERDDGLAIIQSVLTAGKIVVHISRGFCEEGPPRRLLTTGINEAANRQVSRSGQVSDGADFDDKLNEQAAVSAAAHPLSWEELHSRSCRRSRRFLSICSFSLGVMQNMAKCAHKLLITRNSLLGIIFCSAAQSSTGKNMSWENGMT
jgi:hypothetical protein